MADSKTSRAEVENIDTIPEHESKEASSPSSNYGVAVTLQVDDPVEKVSGSTIMAIFVSSLWSLLSINKILL